ncbi:hypothetical protein HAX54_001610 [Datura stramonium]|uniref:Uncharacterized protein n=1 Tax=Datura stramonium TaxID=4076 RepID=A0ABS8T4U7_DATST|nr:hypothetical protein [Datura stramonium]
MAPKVNKGKGVASSSHGSKKARRTSEEEHEDVRMAPQPLRRYGLYWVTEQEDRILTLGLGFVFDVPGDCNLNMLRELLPNWMPKERSNQVKIRGQIIEFVPMASNRLLGTPHVDPQPFINIVKKPPYRDIRYTLCGPNSVARFKESLDDDVATEDEMVKVDSDIESSDDNEEDSKIGEVALSPTDDEE